MEIRELFNEILENYIDMRKRDEFNARSKMYQLVTKDSKNIIENIIRKLDNIELDIEVRASCGSGGWTYYPWIAIFNPNITRTIQEGVYIVYLFSEDMKRVYLTLNQGYTNLKKQLGAKESKIQMMKVRNDIRDSIDSKGFIANNELKVGKQEYEEGCIFYKEYRYNSLPNNEELIKDLQSMINIYKEYYYKFELQGKNIIKDFIDTIRSQRMNKSYKIALLSCFIENDKIKEYITYDEIYKGVEAYYSEVKHRQDMKDKTDFEYWDKNRYIYEMKINPMQYLPKNYFIQNDEYEMYSLSKDIKQYINDPDFIRMFKEAVEFLENKYNWEKGEKRVVGNKATYTNSEEIINYIHSYITSQGYEYNYTLISNLYLSLKTKPFVILAGISGTGKSKLVRLFAESLGATRENNQFNMISVRPDWNDSTDLIGYKNLESKFIKGKLTQIIEDASENLDKPYFVCLDEMNLARVEYYLSDYLSVIESRQLIGETIVTDSLIYDYEIEDEDSLKLPENLYLIGTVNMDDTTFQFSRKVLDRANTIEFSEVNLESLFENEIEKVENMTDIYNDFLKSTYLKTTHIEPEHRDYAKEINKKIIQINDILSKYQKQFAYRVRDEILFYMVENKKSNLLSEDAAFDYQIMQKVLPAINGSENSIKEVLVNLFNFVCEKDILNDADIEEAEKYLQSSTVKYRKSAEKIVYMLKGYNYDGYASYWY